jgi:hypothetical protein
MQGKSQQLKKIGKCIKQAAWSPRPMIWSRKATISAFPRRWELLNFNARQSPLLRTLITGHVHTFERLAWNPTIAYAGNHSAATLAWLPSFEGDDDELGR